VKFKKKHFT